MALTEPNKKRGAPSGAFVKQRQQPGNGDLGDGKNDKSYIPPGIKDQRRADQSPLPGTHRTRDGIVQHCHQGQENEHVELCLKQHR
jgi:hypothetical protein